MNGMCMNCGELLGTPSPDIATYGFQKDQFCSWECQDIFNGHDANGNDLIDPVDESMDGDHEHACSCMVRWTKASTTTI
jgi:hypothetical protein